MSTILVLDNSGCFDIDTNGGVKWHFRNIHCPLYIIDGVMVSSKYRVIPKDTVLTYKWQVPVGNLTQGFSFEIEYIATGTKEYASKKKHFGHAALEDHTVGITIRPEDRAVLVNRAHLEVLTD